MKRNSLIFFLLLLSASGSGTEGEYAVARISPVLLRNANAVIRVDEKKFEIVNREKTILTEHYAITILNENGDSWSAFYQEYDKLKKITSVNGVLYDATGRQIKKMKAKDMEDLTGPSLSDLMDDNRYKRHNFYYRQYPYTIEYTVETTMSHSMFFPTWSPQAKENLSVERSSMTVISDNDYEFRFKAYNYNQQPVITTSKNKKTYHWSVTSLPARLSEPFQPSWSDIVPMVMLGPGQFNLQGYKGNMNTWKDFGVFISELNKGKDILPDNIKAEVKRIAGNERDPVKKIALLYEFMQKNTRYVSIQFGIGGWQPFDAKYVASKSYGDCKALTNYMYSLLKEAGIRSYYTLVRAGRMSHHISEDFPNAQFNHVILCVPVARDTIWLECTSQTLPAGYLSDFTSDRPVLMIKEEGGVIVKTPRYGKTENTESRKINALLDEKGTLKVYINARYTGKQQDNIHDMINSLSKEKVKEILQEELDFATYDIASFDYRETKNILPVINESLTINVSNYATITGKRLFITPNIVSRSGHKLSIDPDRKYDVVIRDEYSESDTVEIDLPAGYEPEAIPQDVTMATPFGKYFSSVKLRENTLVYIRNFECNSGRFPAADYNSFVKFHETIFRSDRNKVVLIKTL